MAKDIEETQSQSENSTVEAVPIAGTPIDETASESIVEVVEEAAPPSERREIVKSATLVSLGNLSSSIIGMVRQITVAATGSLIAGPFLGALTPAQTFNDFLINGSVSGVLIPTFNDYSAPEKREELRRLVFSIVNLVVLISFGMSLLYLIISPWFVNSIIATKFTPEGKLLTLQYSRIIFFSLLALTPFAVLQAALYALKEFGWPALAPTSYHVGIILGALVGLILGHQFFGDYGIAFGVILGAAGEIGLLVPGMRRQHLRYMFVLDLKHPAIRHMFKLYAPVAFSFLLNTGYIFLDQHLASLTPCASFMQGVQGCPEANYAGMKLATTLIQFPGGLVAAALSFAVMPTLTACVREGNMERFKDTLLLGFRLGLLLMVPAAAGLIVLSTPIMQLIFLHGHYTAQDTALGALALQNYSFQLPFLALDQLALFAFYARKNTIIPVIVFVVSVVFGYMPVALPFWSTLGMPALAFANAVQNSLHAVILLVWLRFAIGSLHLRRMLPALLKILLATAVMVAVAWGLQVVLGNVSLFSLSHFIGRLLTVVLVGGLAAGLYFGIVMVLKVEEVALLKGAVLAKLGGKK